MMDSDEIIVPNGDSEWETLIAAWIAAEESGKRESDYDPAWWAVDGVIMWHIDEKHEALWEFITRTFERPMSDKTFAMIAAGPLEDLLADYGNIYIDRIEELARKSPRFNYLLGGVWKNSSNDEVWQRVEKARLTVW